MPAWKQELPIVLPERLDGRDVPAAGRVGVDHEPIEGLGLRELHHPLEGKADLGLVEHVKQDHVVAAVPQPQKRVRIGSGSASRSLNTITSERCLSIAATCTRLRAMSVFPGGLHLRQHRQHLRDLRPFRAGRQAGVELLVEDHQTAGILLVDHQPAERRGEGDRVVEFRQLLAVGVGHRPARVDHEVAGDIGLGLEFLDVVLVGLGVDKPVDVLRIISGGILAMLAELDRKALVGAGMETLKKPADDELGAEIESGDLPHDLGLQIFLDCPHHASLTSRAWGYRAPESRGPAARRSTRS
jgi:hypothetical protein